MSSYRVIITGVDPHCKKGGISFAMSGYISALKNENIIYKLIPTYRPNSFLSKHFLFLAMLPKLMYFIFRMKMKNIPCIVYSHSGAGVSFFREGVIAIFARLLGAKTVMQIHSPETLDYFKSPIKKILFYFALIGVQHIFVLTPWWKKTYLKFGIKKKIYVIPNPLLDSWEKSAKQDLPVCSDKKYLSVLVMSRISPGKGTDLVIEALPYLDSYTKVHVAGDGSLLNTLKSRVKILKQEDKIEFHGWLSGVNKQNLMDSSDILCHPTQLDAMPMNILEAMSNGLPIVALNWGPISDLVPHNAGFLVDQFEPQKIAEAITQLKNTQLRQEMGINAKKWVLQNYSSKKVGKELHEIFSKII